MIDDKGGLIGKNRKIHLFLDEKDFVKSGKSIEIIEKENLKIGMLVCYDAIFPEIARELCMKGSQIIFIPANWPEPFYHQWKIATSARALDNQVWVIACNRIGKDKKFNYFGKSTIINPYGEQIHECSNSEELFIYEIDLNKSNEFKNIINFKQDLIMD